MPTLSMPPPSHSPDDAPHTLHDSPVPGSAGDLRLPRSLHTDTIRNLRRSTPYDHHADNHNNYVHHADNHNTGPSTTQHNAAATTSTTQPQLTNELNYNYPHQRSSSTQDTPSPYDKHCQLSFNDNRLALDITPTMTIVCPRQPRHPPPTTHPGVIRNYEATQLRRRQPTATATLPSTTITSTPRSLSPEEELCPTSALLSSDGGVGPNCGEWSRTTQGFAGNQVSLGRELSQETTSKRRRSEGSERPQNPHCTQETLPEAALPFYGDFSGTWWNAQALFASDAGLQSDKHRHAWSLLAKVDFAGFAETHSTTGHTEAASLPNNTKFFWSHGPTRWQAGVGLGIKHTFLQHFNPTTNASWQEIVPGRAAKLSLRGPSGAVDMYVCYLPTGSQNEDQKLHTINSIRESLAPNNTVLSILMGDWNFVMHDEDRLCMRTMQFTGNTDRPLARNFQALLNTHDLHELEQLAYTHENSTAQSKIDRIYSNHHIADQLDKQFSTATLPRTHLSTHKPITFARRSRQTNDHEHKKVQFPTYILNHKQWNRNLHLNYHEKLHADDNPDNPLRRLELLKQAMWDVATTLQHDTPPEAASVDDKLSWTMIFIRAAETVNSRCMERAATCPHITTYIQAGDPNTRIHPNFRNLRNHSRDLAHQQ